MTRLRIGHTFLTHNYLMTSGAERQVPLCPTCNSQLTVRHIVVDCPSFEGERRANCLSGRALHEVLNDCAPVERVFKFLKDVNLFYRI